MAGKMPPKSKTQKSITSFFGVGAPAKSSKPIATKRTKEAVEKEEEAEATTLVKHPEPKKMKKTEDDTTKPKKTEQEPEEDTVETMEDIDSDEKETVDVEKDESDQEEEEEEQEMPAETSKRKPGRRRLRQRVVSEDSDSESFSDDELNFNAKSKPPQEVVDVEDDEEEEKPITEEKPVEPVATEEGEAMEVDATTTKTKENEPEPVAKEEERVKVEKTKDKVVKTDEKKPEEPMKVDNKKSEVEEVDAEKSPSKPSPKKSVETKDIVKKPTSASSFFQPKAASKPKPSTTKQQSTSTTTSAQEDEVIPNAAIPYASLGSLFSKIEAASSRLVIQDLLTTFFRHVIQTAPEDLLSCIYLCVCTDLAPPFENLKIGIGDAILMKSIGEATGTNLKFIKEMYHKEGDLGKVAQNARSKQHTLAFTSLKPSSSQADRLTAGYVYQQFVKIAKMTGNNSQQQKCSIIKNLLVKCEKDKKMSNDQDVTTAKYIIRGLQGKLRIGLAEKSILMALTYAFMVEKDGKDKEKQQEALKWIKKAFAECPSYNALVQAFYDVQQDVPSAPWLRLKDFEAVAERCVLTPGTPVSPMLARPTKAYALVFDRFAGMPFTCEYKYDGERAQIHILPNGEIAIFSRNFENSTERFPDVKLMIAKASKKSSIQSCIVDAEVVAVDKATNKRLPFQILSTRSRKNVKVEDIKVPVCIYAFDLLYLNGESLLPKPLVERRALLKELFQVEDGSFEFATSMDVDATAANVKDDADALELAVDKVRTFLEEAVKENCEGLMVKTLETEATYEPANRSQKWLKLKKDYLDGIGDSTDLVPIGAFYGRGKRTGVYGAYLLACYDPDTETFQAITKLGTGLSDEVLKQFHQQLQEHVVEKAPTDYAIVDGIKPDVWFAPTCVWEILGADLSISPKYTAAIGLVAKDKGISLRFPRFLRVRDDKEPSQATNAEQIAELYRAQGLATVSNGDDDDDDMLI